MDTQTRLVKLVEFGIINLPLPDEIDFDFAQKLHCLNCAMSLEGSVYSNDLVGTAMSLIESFAYGEVPHNMDDELARQVIQYQVNNGLCVE